MRLPLYNIPRYIDCSGETEDALLLPRGNLGHIQKLLNDCNTFYEITDEREQGISIEVEFTAKLYTEERKKKRKNSLKCSTKFPHPNRLSCLEKQQPYIDMLEMAGAVVSGKENITQRLAVFDAKILWYGSINFLGYSEAEDCSIRICNAEIASAVEAEMIT